MFEIFNLVFQNVIIIILYMMCGFLLVKGKKGITEHAKTFSAVLVYILMPSMIINSFLNLENTKQNVINMVLFFIASFLVQLVLTLILYLLFRRKYSDGKYRIMTVGSVLGNVGFFGLPIVTALFPNNPEVSCYSAMFMFSMNILVFTVGRALITNDPKQASFKALMINPSTIALIVSLPLFLLGVKMPSPVLNAFSVLTKTTTPICMFVLGFRLASMPLKSLFQRPLTYLAVFIKLVVFPLFVFVIFKFIPFFDDVFKSCIFILSAMPSAAVILSMSELYDSETELSANTVLLSTLFCIVTIPLLSLLI